MLTTVDANKVLVLRLPEQAGNFRFRMAELPDVEARRWEERLSKSSLPQPEPEIGLPFSDPLTLDQVMQAINTRDFRVLDLPSVPH